MPRWPKSRTEIIAIQRYGKKQGFEASNAQITIFWAQIWICCVFLAYFSEKYHLRTFPSILGVILGQKLAIPRICPYMVMGPAQWHPEGVWGQNWFQKFRVTPGPLQRLEIENHSFENVWHEEFFIQHYQNSFYQKMII